MLLFKKYKTSFVCFTIVIMVATNLMAQNVEQLAQQKPVQLTGNFSAKAIMYNATGINARRQPFSWILSGSPTLKLYGFDIPFSFSLSEQDRSFSQPFNQFGLSPTYKWITVHGGYRNLSFSPYTLDGHTILGAGIEIKPKGFSLAIMHGRLNRATTLDTTFGTLQPFSFSRKGTAVKITAGNNKNHFSISTIKAQDDSASVQMQQSIKQNVKAAQNIAASADFKIENKNGVFIEGDAAVSIYTNDMYSNLKIADSNEWVKSFSNIISINATTQANTAYRAAAGIIKKNYSIKAEYKYISPDYKSMGVYFFNSDIESITINPSFNIKNTFIFNGSIGTLRDNLKNQKQATTKRLITMANATINLSQKFGIDASVTNFSANATPVVVQIQNKYLLTQSNSNISITPRYTTSNTRSSHVIMFSYNKASLTDKNEQTATENTINTNILLFNYVYSIFKSALTIGITANKTTNTFSLGNFNNTGAGITLSKAWFKNKLQTSFNGNYTNSKSANNENNFITAQVNIDIQLLKPGKLNLRYALLNNKPAQTIQNNGFAENTFEVGYNYHF